MVVDSACPARPILSLLEKGEIIDPDPTTGPCRMPRSVQVVQGKQLDGAGLADLVQQVVEGLNERDIPTGGECVDAGRLDLESKNQGPGC